MSAVTLGCVDDVGGKERERERESSHGPRIGSAHIRLLHNVTKNNGYL